NATALADWLVRRGVPFRSAHRLVSRAVRECLDGGFTLENFPLESYRRIDDAFDQDLYAALTLDAVLAARDVRGGTSRRAVKAALARARADHSDSRAAPAGGRVGPARPRGPSLLLPHEWGRGRARAVTRP